MGQDGILRAVANRAGRCSKDFSESGYNLMWNQARAIVGAQWRTARNYIPRSNKTGLIFSGVLMAVWYAGFGFLAVLTAIFLANPDEVNFVHRVFPTMLLLGLLYWQIIPILMASTGSALDIRKLLVYPIPHRQLFALEVLLRISTGIEMLLLLAGAGTGLLLNPKIPFWAPWTLAFFVAFNLLCSAGIRDLLVRMLARKRVREIATLLFVLAAALPQLMLLGGFQKQLRRAFRTEASPFWLWTAAARLAQGEFSWSNIAVVLSWTAAAYFFGRWQFERGLSFDFGEAAASSAPRGRTASRLDWFYQPAQRHPTRSIGGLDRERAAISEPYAPLPPGVFNGILVRHSHLVSHRVWRPWSQVTLPGGRKLPDVRQRIRALAFERYLVLECFRIRP